MEERVQKYLGARCGTGSNCQEIHNGKTLERKDFVPTGCELDQEKLTVKNLVNLERKRKKRKKRKSLKKVYSV